MARNVIQLEDRAIGEVWHVADARQVRLGGAASDVDENAIGFKRLAAHLDRAGCDEAGVTLDQSQPGKAPQPMVEVFPGLLCAPALTGLQRFRIDCHHARHINAKVRGTPREMGGVGRRHKRLSRRAARVHAGAPDQFTLDQSHRQACCGEPASERRTGLSRTDYDRVEGVAHCSTTMAKLAPAIATASSMSAAGGSRLKLAARRARAAAPPRVPNTAP